ncbi:MAG: T9SS type A sorting domain-containing protein [Schleiferiaceae bacterium]|nr:T9SS type A sorting domain-containing protein [Schleiferiaceae bacterium]
MKNYKPLNWWLGNKIPIKRGCLGILFFILTQTAFSQVYFNRLYNEGVGTNNILVTSSGYFSDIQIQPQNTVGVVSTHFDFFGNRTTRDTTLRTNYNTFRVKTALLDTENEKIYSLIGYKYFNDFGSLGLLIHGPQKKTIGPDINFQDTVSVAPYDIITHEKKIIITGYTWKWQAAEQRYQRHLLLMQLDTLGNKIWEQSYTSKPSFWHLQGYNVIATQEGGYAVGGFGYNIGNVLDVASFLLVTDSVGNKINERYFENPENGNTALLIHQKTNGNFLVAYSKGYENSGPWNAGQRSFYTTVEELDKSSLQTIWSKDFLPGYHNYRSSYKLTRQNDSTFLISGIYWPDRILYEGEYASQLGFIFAITENGDSLWYRDYGSFTEPLEYNYLNDIAITPDGGIVGAGRIETSNSPITGGMGMHAWLFKADSIGCLYPGCDTVYHTAPTLPTVFQVYPNPVGTGQQLNLAAPDVTQATATLYNVLGQAVLQTPLTFEAGKATLFTESLASGFYTLHLQTGTGKRYVEKVVVE